MDERFNEGNFFLSLKRFRITGNVEERPANVKATLRQARRMWSSSFLRVSLYHNVEKEFVLIGIIAIISKMLEALLYSTNQFIMNMTHYFCLIMAGREIDSDTRIFKVSVGTSRQSDRDYLFLVAQSVQNNWYFEKWSSQVADFVQMVLESLAPEKSDDPLGGTIVEGITARELVRNLKMGSRIPTDPQLFRNANHIRHWLSLNYRTLTNRQGEAQSLPSE